MRRNKRQPRQKKPEKECGPLCGLLWGEDEIVEDELLPLPAHVVTTDPLYRAHVTRTFDGVSFPGIIVDVEWDRLQLERVYRVRFLDGDMERLSADEVQASQLRLRRPSARGI